MIAKVAKINADEYLLCIGWRNNIVESKLAGGGGVEIIVCNTSVHSKMLWEKGERKCGLIASWISLDQLLLHSFAQPYRERAHYTQLTADKFTAPTI